jgi:hypothetical protein
MKHKLIAAAVLLTLWPVFSTTGAEANPGAGDVRLMNVNNVLRNYGFENGVFNSVGKPVKKIDPMTEIEYGSIEDKSNIDTPEEFITAVYYSPIKIDQKAQAAIDRELPKGKTGALRLAAMWYFKIAEYPENREKYMSAINLVLKMAKEKHQVSVTLSDARKFYEEAIKEKIYATPLGAPLTADEQKKVKELLLAYMLEPGERTQRAFTDYKDTLNSRDVTKGSALITFVKKISARVNAQLA